MPASGIEVHDGLDARQSTGNPKENSTRRGMQPRTHGWHRRSPTGPAAAARRVTGSGPGVLGQRRQRPSSTDVVGGGVAAGVAGPQQTGQRLPAGDVGPVQKHSNGWNPNVFPGRRSVLSTVRDGDRGIEVQPQLPPRSGAAPAAQAARGPPPAPPGPAQMRASIRSSSRHVVVIDATGPQILPVPQHGRPR